MDLELKLDSLLDSIDLLLSKKHHGSALILIYSTIDILAWLGRGKDHQDVKRSDFLAWVKSYLLPIPNSSVSAIDLYAARCSLLHSYSAESKLSRNKQSSEIFYAWGSAESSDLQELIGLTDRTALALQVEDLVEALKLGIIKFLADFQDTSLLAERNEKLFANVDV